MNDPPRPTHDVGLGDALDGFLGGITFILSTPSVWGWALIPAVMMLFLLCTGTMLGAWGLAEALDALFGPDRGTWGAIGYWTLMILMGFVVLLIAVLFALTLAQPLSGYALEKIAHAQEFKLTGRRRPSPSWFASLWLNLRTVSFTLLVGGTALAALFMIGFLFPPAAVVTVPLKFFVCAWMLAWDFLDYPLGLRGLGVSSRLAWVVRHFGSFTLFGVLWAAICVVPGIALMILPMGVAGATRMVLRDDPGS